MWCCICLCALSLAAGEPAVGSFPPDLGVKSTLNNPAGKGPITLESYIGKVVLIDFWATWCGPCKAAIPHVRELHEKYAAQGLVVIGHTDASSQGLEAYVASAPIPYLVTVGEDIGVAWGVRGIPHVFLLDVAGKVAWSGHPAELQEKTVTDLLAKVKPAGPPAPHFKKPAADIKVVALEQQAAAGKVGNAVKALGKLTSDSAKSTLEQIATWKAAQDAEIDRLAAAGEAYAAWHLADALADAYKGADEAKAYQERAATLKKDPAYEAGKEYQKLVAIPPSARKDPRFAKLVETFLKKHGASSYGPLAKALLP
jgi:thiol-disulfide isomerase/thioredoxin